MSMWGLQLAVNILTIASVVAAAAFGALGLFTDYKKDGKVTRFGSIAALGILLSAVMSISVGLLQDRIEGKRATAAAAAEKVQSDKESQRFAQQINRLGHLNAMLGNVSRTAGDVRDDMRDTLRAQQRLMADTQRSLLLTEQIGVQQRTSTDRTLRTMWEDANRIDPAASISANINYLCPVKAGASLPPLLKDGAWMDIYLLPRAEALRRVTSYKRFSFRSALEVPFQGKRPWSAGDKAKNTEEADAGVRLKSVEQQVFSTGTAGSFPQIVQISRFGPFYAQGIWSYSAPSSWRALVLEAVVKGPPPVAIEKLADLLSQPIGGREELADVYDAVDKQIDKGETLSVLPCRALLQVRVNGRLVAEPIAPLLYYSNGTSRFLMLKFPIVDVPATAFPQFNSAARPLALGPSGF